ncbi:uncharacterized protein LOC142760572 [Rhinoderma darwinii]|uniref:uncharacterized protein LOC142760572 n=1 Tax=Rhinoderma darwinii TaxID=43563 RepID=UPI003F66B7BA
MDVLLMELIRRAESEGGENWLRQCLAAAPSREVEGRSELTGLENDIEEAVSPAGSSLEVPSSAAAKRMKSAAESSLRVERSSGRSLQVPELERRRPTVSSKKVAHSAGSAQQVPAQLANPLARRLVRERETTGWSGTPSCSKDGVEDTAEAPASLVLEAAQDFSSELQPRKRSRKTRVAYSPPPPVSRRRRGPRSQLSCQQVSPGSTGTQQEVAEVVHDPGQVEQSVAEVQNDGTRSGALWNSVSSSFMESDLGLIYVNIQRSLAPRTWADYSAAWKEWVNFCVNENSLRISELVAESKVSVPGLSFQDGNGFDLQNKEAFALQNTTSNHYSFASLFNHLNPSKLQNLAYFLESGSQTKVLRMMKTESYLESLEKHVNSELIKRGTCSGSSSFAQSEECLQRASLALEDLSCIAQTTH